MTKGIQEKKLPPTWGGIMAFVRDQGPGITVYRVGGPETEVPETAFQTGSASAVGCLFDAAGKTAQDLDGTLCLLDPWLARKPQSMIFGLRIRLSGIGDSEPAATRLQSLYDQGLRLIHWIRVDPGETIHRPLLWQTSKAGIWNHLSGKDLFSDPDPSGMGAWIANNPNIVHSFAQDGPAGEPQTVAPRTLRSYGKLPDIPGVPFWQTLGTPERILAALGQVGARDLQRLRADRDRQEAFGLGDGLVYHFIKPSDIDARTMDQIVAMVDAGGAVDITLVRANLEKAYLIAYVTERGVIVGNSSLKHPRQAFIDRLNRITGLDFTRFVERGYTSVRPEYRSMGIGAKLLEGLTSRATDVKIFSLIGEDNLATQKIALRNKTRKIAVYYSEKVGKDMGVWMPEHMIDDSWELDL